jgi:hypothetical protein
MYHSAERYLTSILLPWPRVSKMLAQPCTNLDRHRAPRRCARSLLQCSPACTQMKSPRTAGKNVGLCHIRAHLASIYIVQKLDPPYRARKCRGKTPFYKRAFSNVDTFLPSRRGADTRFTPLYKADRAKITTDARSDWRSRWLIRKYDARVYDQHPYNDRKETEIEIGPLFSFPSSRQEYLPP